MKKILLILPIVFIAILSASLVLGTSAMIQASFSTNPTAVSPGSDGYMQLTLKNVGTTGINSIKVGGINYGQYITVDTSGIGNLGSLGAGESTTYLFKFSASSNAPSGLYTVKFSIDYCTDSSCTEIDPTDIIDVQTPSTLQITSVEPSTLAAGQTTTLNFSLKNNGADAINNIILTWQAPNNEILPLGLSNRQFISSLNGGASITIPVDVSVSSSVSPGIYPLSISMQYFDRSGTSQNIASSVGIKIGGNTQFDVEIQSSSAGTTTLSIANIGVNPATSVEVIIPDQKDFSVSGATNTFLGTLNSGDFGVASFQINSKLSLTNPTGPTNTNPTIPTNQTARTTQRNLTVEISYSDTSGARQVIQEQVPLNLGTAAVSSRNFPQNRGIIGILTEFAPYIIIAVVAIVLLVWFFKFRNRKKK